MERWINIQPSYGRQRGKEIYTKDLFFHEPVIAKIFYDRLEFTHPNLDYRGPLHEPYKIKDRQGWVSFGITSYDIPLGSFEIDEDESNEDLIIVYFD